MDQHRVGRKFDSLNFARSTSGKHVHPAAQRFF